MDIRSNKDCLSFTYYFSGSNFPEEDDGMEMNREVNHVANKKKVQDNYKTPNEKFNAEFAEENSTSASQKGSQKVQENFKKPNEKFDAEFAEFGTTNTNKANR